jgi:hypothetical protein
MHQSYFIRGNTIDGGDVQPHNMEISDKSITIGWIREKATENEFQLTGHAHKERQEEVIKTKEIRDALMQGELLENYPDDPRGPSCLVLGYSEGRAIHIVCGRTRVDWLLIITVYMPGPSRWINQRTRIKRGDRDAA